MGRGDETVSGGTLVLTGGDVAAVLDLDGCIRAVAEGLRLHAEGRSLPPRVLGLAAEGGGFHVKAAGLKAAQSTVAVKVNANFPENPRRRGLPTVQGVLALFDATDGRLLALLDSMEITALRTAAATAVAAQALARPRASSAAVCGCGRQGRVQLRALMRVRPVREAAAWDLDRARAAAFADEMGRELGIPVRVATTAAGAVAGADLVVTCTPSREPFLRRQDVRPGAFVAAVGADHEHKQELAADLLASARVVVDDVGQCAAMGELHHALDAGLMTVDDVHAELADVIAGRRPGRTRDDETFVFDSTGVALWDVSAAVEACHAASREGRGLRLDLGA
jgi:ornithine cyclodeaminase/alanine dehydrogenase-like protein (mu-crystallin family)